MKNLKLIIGIILLSLISCKSNIKTDLKTESYGFEFPKFIGYVNDFENIFTENEIIELENLVSKYEKKTTNEIVIVTIDSITPFDNIHRFSTELGSKWKVGKKDKNNGLLIAFSKNLKSIGISTGYGTEKILTDLICKKVIDSTMTPKFKKGEYYTGIKNGVSELMNKWN